MVSSVREHVGKLPEGRAGTKLVPFPDPPPSLSAKGTQERHHMHDALKGAQSQRSGTVERSQGQGMRSFRRMPVLPSPPRD